MPRRAPASRRPAAQSPRRGARKGARILGVLFGVLLFLGGTGVAYMREPAAARHIDGALTAGGRIVSTAANAAEDAGARALQPSAPGEYLVARVERVVDGDTLLVHVGTREERVRLLCVDAPESVHPDKTKNTPIGREASAFLKSRVEGLQVRLEGESAEEKRDRYGRLLSYVIVDGTNINVELVRAGFAEYDTNYGKSRRYDHDFTRAQETAQQARKGIWK